MIDLIERLQAYSADSKLRPDYAAAMIEAADALVSAKAHAGLIEAALEDAAKDARRFVFLVDGMYAEAEELDKLNEAGNKVKDQLTPNNIDELRAAIDAVQAEYDKL